MFELTALRIVQEQAVAQEAEAGRPTDFTVKDVVSRRVLMSAYVITYKHMGVLWYVFINGTTGAAFGMEHFGRLFTREKLVRARARSLAVGPLMLLASPLPHLP